MNNYNNFVEQSEIIAIKEKFNILKTEQQLEILKTKEKLKILKEKYAIALLNYQEAKKQYYNKFGNQTTQEIMAMDSETLQTTIDSIENQHMTQLACIKNTLLVAINYQKDYLSQQQEIYCN